MQAVGRDTFLLGEKWPELHIVGVGIFGSLESRVEVKETCAHNIIIYETYSNNNHDNIIIMYIVLQNDV